MLQLQDKFEEGLTTAKPLSDHHVKPKSTQDIQFVVNELMAQRAFKIEGERHHSEFQRWKPLLNKVNKDNIVAWIEKTARYILHDQ